MTEFYIYLAVINTITFLAFGIDKLCAILNRRRISEKMLISFSAIGGSLGALVGMVLFKHKISKPRFRYSVPIFFFIYFFALLYQALFL